MAASLYDHLYSSSLSVHEVLMYALHGQIDVGGDLDKIIKWPFLDVGDRFDEFQQCHQHNGNSFFITAYLWGAWNTKSVMMWFDPWGEWKMRTSNDDVITGKIGWQVGTNWHSTRYISITADISTKYLVTNCSVALTTLRIYARHWLPDWQSSCSLGSSFFFLHCFQQISISSSGQPDW